MSCNSKNESELRDRIRYDLCFQSMLNWVELARINQKKIIYRFGHESEKFTKEIKYSLN